MNGGNARMADTQGDASLKYHSRSATELNCTRQEPTEGAPASAPIVQSAYTKPSPIGTAPEIVHKSIKLRVYSVSDSSRKSCDAPRELSNQGDHMCVSAGKILVSKRGDHTPPIDSLESIDLASIIAQTSTVAQASSGVVLSPVPAAISSYAVPTESCNGNIESPKEQDPTDADNRGSPCSEPQDVKEIGDCVCAVGRIASVEKLGQRPLDTNRATTEAQPKPAIEYLDIAEDSHVVAFAVGPEAEESEIAGQDQGPLIPPSESPTQNSAQIRSDASPKALGIRGSSSTLQYLVSPDGLIMSTFSKNTRRTAMEPRLIVNSVTGLHITHRGGVIAGSQDRKKRSFWCC